MGGIISSINLRCVHFVAWSPSIKYTKQIALFCHCPLPYLIGEKLIYEAFTNWGRNPKGAYELCLVSLPYVVVLWKLYSTLFSWQVMFSVEKYERNLHLFLSTNSLSLFHFLISFIFLYTKYFLWHINAVGWFLNLNTNINNGFNRVNTNLPMIQLLACKLSGVLHATLITCVCNFQNPNKIKILI